VKRVALIPFFSCLDGWNLFSLPSRKWNFFCQSRKERKFGEGNIDSEKNAAMSEELRHKMLEKKSKSKI
jgi:hypothetical protein